MNTENENRDRLLAKIQLLEKRVKELEEGIAASDESQGQTKDFLELVRYLPDIVYRIDGEGKFTFVSDYVHVLGYSPEELIGKHFSMIIHPDDVVRVSRSHVLPNYSGKATGPEKAPSLFDERRRFSRIRRGAEIRLLTKASSQDACGNVYIDAEVSAAGDYAIEQDKEIFRGTIGVIRDISFKQRIAQKRESHIEKKYQELLEKTKDAIVHVDRSGNVIFANSAFFVLFAASVDDIKNFIHFANAHLDEQSKNDFDAFWNTYCSAGVLSDGIDELCWKMPDGKYLITENITSLLTDHNECFECLQLIMRDITNKKHIEKVLRESEELFHNLAEQLPLMIAIVSDARVVYVNKHFEKTIGYNRQEILDSAFDYYELFNPECREELKRLHERVLGKESVKEFECVMQNRERRRLDVIFSPNSIRYQGRDVILDTIIDITERKLLEENTRKSQKLESLSVLAAGIAHDFNNILTVIMGNITLSRINPKDPDLVVKNLSAAEEAVSRARELTRQFLAFSRNAAPLKKVMPLDGIIRDAVMFSTSGAMAKVDLFISDDLWPAEVDDGQIGQVISNIIINAIQSMPDGGTVTVRASNKFIGEGSLLPLPPGNYVTISVQDTGIGISPDNLSKIFDPYFSSKEIASGLGLAISYSIIVKHGGFIDVQSTVGVGSLFTIYLPAFPEEIASEVIPTNAIRGGKARILLMDDDDGVITIVTQFLSYLGYESETARDGAEAIEKFTRAMKETKPFSAVILDLLVTNGMGGKDALAALKEMDPHVRAVLATGYLDDPVVLNFHEHGFSELIKKPFRIEELSRVLHRVLS